MKFPRHGPFAALHFLFAIVTLGTLLSWSPPAEARDDPALNYHTIKTDHFYVHYYDGLEALARRTAQLAEESHIVLSPILDWTPGSRTHVLVTDKLDTANGFARVMGRNFITIFGMPPQADSVLGYYDDWLRVLVYHEYVHILHLDTNPGLPQIINRVIGKQYHPNSVLPRWYIEGIAVYLETYRTGSGRVSSPLFQMWLRTAALEDSLFTLGQSTGVPMEWPSGSGAYLYGAFFIDYIVRQHGENYIRDFNHRYGRRLIPFAMSYLTREITGDDLETLWEGFIAEAQAEARARQIAIRAQGETTLELLTDGGGRSRYPAIRPGNDSVTFHRADQLRHPAYTEIRAPGTPMRALVEADGAAGPSAWSPDGEHLYFTRANVYRSVYNFQDLFRFTPETGELIQLTRGERAREPALSPDGKRLAYVRNRAGSMELVLLDLEDEAGQPQVVLGRENWAPEEDGHWQQIATPVFTPDGQGLVFGWWRLDRRKRDLFYVDLDTFEFEALTDTASHEMEPHFGPDGLLYFTADVEGIFNIHAMDIETRQVWQVSNVLNGVFAPQVTEDGRWIYVHTYTYKGFEIARFRHPLHLSHPDRRPRESVHPRIEWPQPSLDSIPESTPYRPLPWLLPMTFLPDLGVVSGGTGISATITGYDPADHHTYSLSGGLTSGPTLSDQRRNIGLSYRYGGTILGVSTLLRYQELPRPRSLILGSQFVPYLERQLLGRLGLSYALRLPGHTFSFSSNFTVEHTAELDREVVEIEPGDIRPQEPVFGFFNQLSLGVGYSRLFRYPRSISTSRGVSANASLGLQHPALGSQENSVTFSYGLDAFHPNPLFERHVFALSLRGAATRSAAGPQRLYSIGGHTPQDVLTNLIFQDPRGGAVLRGYPPGHLRGSQYQVWRGEYRFPIRDFDQGFSTAPVFVRNLKGAAFADLGTAYDGVLFDANLASSIGAEMQLDAILGYYASNSLRLGYARGLQEGGINELYLLFGASF